MSPGGPRYGLSPRPRGPLGSRRPVVLNPRDRGPAATGRPVIPSPARLGLIGDTAIRDLEELGWYTEECVPVLWALSRAADPGVALAALVRLRDAAGDGWAGLDAAIRDDLPVRGRLFGLLGASTALGDHLIARPDRWRLLAEPIPERPEMIRRMLASVDAVPEEGRGAADLGEVGMYRAGLAGPSATVALREAYRDMVMILAAHDMAAIVEDEPVLWFRDVGRVLADLADAALTAALAVAVTEVHPDEPCSTRLGVVAMGKCGARELNYISDVDVVFVAEPPDPRAARLAGEMMRIGSAAFFEVDAALRPEGKRGELVRTLDSHVAYYERWARTWEFQALLKARPMTGDMDLARAHHAALNPMVWEASTRDAFVEDVQAMRRRVEENIPAKLREREIKLGRGGLRDVEFAVQLLQMVHGRADESLRVTATVDALGALVDGGYVGRDDGANMIASYEFLRLLEHRLQLQRLRRTHTLPEEDDEEAMRWLARAAHMRPDGRSDALGVLREEIRRHLQRVRRLHSKLFYRPLLSSIAGYDTEALRLSPDAVERQLGALGFRTPRNAVGHLRALTASTSRRGRIQALLLPTLLEWLADTPDPDGGLLAYRRLSEEIGGAHWYLKMLRDEDAVAQRLMRVLGASPYVAELLLKATDVVKLYADGANGPKLVEQDEADVARGVVATAARYDDPERAIDAARSLRRAELARIASASLLGMMDVAEVCRALSRVWVSVLDAALHAVIRASGPPQAAVAVIGMGRLGGHELGFGSDADVLFVCEPVPGADEAEAVRWAIGVADRVRTLLGAPSTDPPLEVDADLRPEGRSGPLVRSFASYEAYYSQWAETWEIQALLRADAICGDEDLGRRFLLMIDRHRYPAGGVSPRTVQEIRRMKARIDAERLPRGADPSTHTKLGRGGLTDVEWTVQLLTLQHAHEVPALHNTSTLEALDAIGAADLMSAADVATLRTAWLTATGARNALVLVKGKRFDQLPRPGAVLTAVAHAAGWDGDPAEYLDTYLRVTRRARQVVERVFWGE